MKRIKCKVLALLASIFLCNNALADYLNSYSISYKSLGNSKYQVDLVLYSEGMIGKSPLEDVQSFPNRLTVSSAKLSKNLNFTLTKNGGTNTLIPFCGGSKWEYSNIVNVTRYTYSGEINLPAASDDWILGFKYDFRSKLLNTIVSPEKASIYVEALINNKVTKANNSAILNTSPVVGAFKNTATILNLAATDSDSSKLSYTLESSRVDANVDLAYANGYSAAKPVSLVNNLLINASTGAISIKPTKENERGIVDLKITEKDAFGNVVGYTTHGVQISTTTNLNTAPTLGGINGETSNMGAICANNFTGSIGININDTGSDNEYSIYAFNSKNNAVQPPTISGKSIVATIPTAPGTYEFQFAVKEVNNCPNNLNSDTIKYKFTVNENPKVSIAVDGNKKYYTCYDLGVTSSVQGGKTPYKYAWSDTKTTVNNSVTRDEVLWLDDNMATKSLTLSIVDSNGCSATSNTVKVDLSLYYLGSVTQQLHYCSTSDTTTVTNSLFPKDPNDKISNISWTVEDGTVFNTEKLKYKFPKIGDNPVILKYNYDGGKCEYKRNVTIEICTPPSSYKFEHIDTCSNNYIFYYKELPEVPPYSMCSGPSTQQFFIDSVEYTPKSLKDTRGANYFELPDLALAQGIHQFMVKSKYDSDCEYTAMDSVNIIESPDVDIMNSMDQLFINSRVERDCRRLDTTFYAKINKNLNGALNYSWNNSTNSLKKDSVIVAQSGTYKLLVTDKYGCKDSASVAYLDPIYGVDLVSTMQPCYPDSTFNFVGTILENFPQDKSKIKRYWDFGDTQTAITFNDTISHAYAERKKYTAKLKITNALNCEISSNPVEITNEYLIDILNIKPLNADTVVCLPNQIMGYSVKSAPLGSTINNIVWYVDGNAQSVPVQDSASLSINKAGETEFRFEATYNNSCSYKSKSVKYSKIYPDYNVRIIPTKYCVTDSVELTRAVYPFDIKIVKQTWALNIPLGVTASAYDPTKESLKVKIKNRTTIDAAVTTIDEHGCIRNNSLSNIPLESTAKITAKFDTACELSATQIRLFTENRDPITGQPAVLQTYGISNNGFVLDTGIVNRDNATNSIGTPLYPIFKTPGIVPITIYAINDKNTPYDVNFPLSPGTTYPYPRYCRFTIDTNIYVRPAPELNFVTDTVCVGVDSVHFINKSYYDKTFKYSDKRDSIVSFYSWNFGDGDTLKSYNATHWYKKGGFIPVTLKAKTYKCSYAYVDTIYVKETPNADFTITPDSIHAEVFQDIVFTNTSSPKASIDRYIWNFGDQTPNDTIENTIHKYTDIDKYKITLVASNKEGCVDTATKYIELGSILDVPTAFSPNGDGTNDVFRLIQRYIEKLDHFTVYNRWGQVVFDASGDVEAAWDGRYKGVDQEMGIYVVYVKGKGKDKKEYNFKKDLTLVR